MESRITLTILLAILVVLVITALAVVLIRRAKSKRKIRQMTTRQKVTLIDEIAEPFGFFYVPDWGIFSTLRNAWQRTMGYEALYDRAAPSAHMALDVMPVYFDFEGRTWLIEFWKGQYGITSGGEVGVYHADSIVAPHDYHRAHFDSAEDCELPWIKCRLMHGEKMLYAYEARHWWLTGFAVGHYAKPRELRLYTAITFGREAMAEAFCEGLQRCESMCDSYERCDSCVYIAMRCGRRNSGLTKIRNCWAQFWNRIWVRVYLGVTRPFHRAEDQLLFLYFQLPSLFRRMLRFHGKRCKAR